MKLAKQFFWIAFVAVLGYAEIYFILGGLR